MIIERLGSSAPDGALQPEAVGHRVVHGGGLFTEAVAIDDDVLAKIESLNDLAPLHNPAAVSGIHAARKIFGKALPMAAVFDTAFHHTIPETAATYAIHAELAKKHGIRRYGFHGMAHRYSLLRYAELNGVAPSAKSISSRFIWATALRRAPFAAAVPSIRRWVLRRSKDW